MYLSSIYCYPIKSCQGMSLTSWHCDQAGLAGDREWMVVGAQDGIMRTQRTHPLLARVQARLDDAELTVSIHGDRQFSIPRHHDQQEHREYQELDQATCWSATCDVADAGQVAADFFSDLLSESVRLVRQRAPRPADDNPRGLSGQTRLSDGFPLLLISQASLDALNGRLPDHVTPLSMWRFRPNLVIADSAPHAEDQWQDVCIGDLPLAVVKPCQRCVVTTIDPQTGDRSGPEPLKTLAQYRRQINQDGSLSKKVLFGQNVIPLAASTLMVGAPVRVMK